MYLRTNKKEWLSFIYHDHVSWFPGSGYMVEKLFSDHYAVIQLASASGTSKDMEKRSTFFDEIPQMKPEDWHPVPSMRLPQKVQMESEL